MQKIFSIVVFVGLMFIISCSHSSNQTPKPDEKKIREKLIDLNKERIAEENDQIDEYINRFGYKMNTTETGLRYMILSVGKGETPNWMSEVKVKYRVDLLDGTYCYSSDSSGVLDIKLGQSAEPTGLQEGVQKLKAGGKALLIVPSYLAYGLTGDGNKINGAQSLVYNIELVEIKK